jgi:predicted acyl esterase
MIFEHNVQVTMTDGLNLRINVYRPDKPGRFPVVMLYGPYGKDTRDADAPPYQETWKKLIANSPLLCKTSSCRYIRWEAPDPECWIPDGYVIIHADSRGSNASPGFLASFSPRHTEDFSTLITWAAHQPWSNGKVGLLGISYYAINQWQVAARQPEGLAAIIPWEGAFDHYRDIANHGGIPSTEFQKTWSARQVAINQNGNGEAPYVDAQTGQKATGEALPPLLLKANRTSPGDILPSQPFDGAYYHERTPDPSRIQVPLLSVGNWGGQGLHGRGNVEGYLAAGSKLKWLRIHTGDHHAPFYAEDSLALQKRFFDRFLKGENNGWDNEPKISLAIRRPDGISWRNETEWPLNGTQRERYHLDASNGQIGAGKVPSAAENSYQAMSDGITFKTAVFAEDTEFTGPVKLKLWVKSSTTDMDVFATLRLIDPDGHDVTFDGASEPHAPVSQGWLRVSHRAFDPDRSTEYRPYHPRLIAEGMVPGQLCEADVEIWPASIVAPKGYRLALTIQGKDWEQPGLEAMFRGSGPFLHTERDPAIYGGTNTVATGEGQSSYLLLPRIPKNR